jgi:hypothetical protein
MISEKEGRRMSPNESPAQIDIDALKAKLSEFITRSSVRRFEADDLVQLLEEGEGIDWIVEQLKADSPTIDVEEAAALLAGIRQTGAPEIVPAPRESQEEAMEALEQTEEQPDLSQLDMSQLAGMLPPGVQLPPGMDMRQLKNLMESAQGQMMADFLLFCQERGIQPDERMLDDPRVQKLQNEWKSTPREALNGKTPAEMMAEGQGFMPEKVETFRRMEPHVGRNDPCPCGSGKKYKKCCGRA